MHLKLLQGSFLLSLTQDGGGGPGGGGGGGGGGAPIRGGGAWKEGKTQQESLE